MKKGWKIFWVMCISLSVLAIALCISGILLGATAENIQEVFGIRHMARDGARDYFEKTHAYLEDAGDASSYDAREPEGSSWEQYYSDIQELKIDVSCLQVDIYEGDGSDIIVNTYDVDQEILDDLVIQKKNEELKIEMKNKKRWEIPDNENRGTLNIQIPPGLRFQEVSVTVGAGVFSASGLCAEELDIEVGAGQVYLHAFTAEELDLECGAGTADLYGDVQKEAKIECGVGQVTYTAEGSQADFDYKVNCGIGSVTVGDDSYSGLGSERKISNGGSKKMEIECGIGLVDVSFEG